ncbi:MAG: peptide-methionine (R)-S-oxide reductase, partial [Rhizobium leguminosarum]|nr:peptide-methionine (R)-S-oxide reductase [Rhizobium leguminosarum]
MLNRRMLLLNTGLAAIGLKLALSAKNANADETFAVTHTDAEWQSLLSSDQYAVLRKEATERPFTSPLLNEHRKGNFACAGCDLESF